MDSKRLLQLLTKVAFVFVVMFAFAGTTMAQTYYVSTSTGSDSFNGSQANVGTFPNGPFKTIGAAMAVAADGVTVVIEAGTYAEDWTIDDDITVQTTASGANVTITVGTGGGFGLILNGSGTTATFAGGGATIALATGENLDLNAGSLTLASGALRIASGSTINRDNGSILGSAPTFGTNTSVTYDQAGTTALTAGLEVPASLGTGSITITKTGGSVTFPAGFTAASIVHSGAATATYQGNVTTTGAIDLDGGAVTFSGTTVAGGLVDMDGGNATFADLTANGGVDVTTGNFTATNVTLGDADTFANATTTSITGQLTINIDEDNAAVTPINNDGTMTVGTVAFAYVDTSLEADASDTDNVMTIDNDGDLTISAWSEAGSVTATANGVTFTATRTVSSTVNITNDTAGSRLTFSNSAAISGTLGNTIATPDGVHFNGGGSIGGVVTNTGTITIATSQTLTLNSTGTHALADFNGSGTLVIANGGDHAGIDSDGNVTVNASTGASNNTGAATVDGTYTINDEGTHGGAITAGSLVIAADPVDITGAVTVSGNATFDADGTGDGPDITGALSVTGTATFNDDTTVTGNFTAGNAVVSDDLTLSSAAGTHNVSGTLTVNGTMALGAGASTITVGTTAIDPAGTFTLAAGNTYRAQGSFTGGVFDGTGVGAMLRFDLPSGTTTFSPGPNTAVNNFLVSGNERTLTISQGFEVQNDLTVDDDATLDLTNKLIRLTATDGTGQVEVAVDAMVTAASNSGALSFEGTAGAAPNFTVTSDTGGQDIGTLTNIIVNRGAGAAANSVFFDEDVTITGVVSLVNGGITVEAGDTMTFSGDAAGISVNTSGTSTAIAGTTAGVYDLTYAGGATVAAGAEFADPGTNVIDDLTINMTGGTLTLTPLVGINGNFTVAATSTVSLTGGLIVGGNATINATDASDGTVAGAGSLSLNGADKAHTFAGLVTAPVIFAANSTATGDTDNDRASTLTNVSVAGGTTVTITGVQEIDGTLTVLGTLGLSLSDSDGTGTDDQDVAGAILVDENGSLTLNSNISALSSVTVGNGGAGSATLNMNGNSLTMEGGAFTADADAALGSTGTLVLNAGSDVGTDATATGTPANLPNVNVNAAGTTLTSDLGVSGTLDVDEDFALGAFDVFLSGNATFTSAAAPTSITGTGRFIASGSTLTMSQDTDVPNFTVNGGGATLASNNTTSRDFTVSGGEFQFDAGTMDVGSQDLVLGGGAFMDYNGGTFAGTGWVRVNDDNDGDGGADFDIAGTGGSVTFINLSVDVAGGAAADADDGLDINGSDIVNITGRLNLLGGTVFTDDGTTDGSVVLGNGVRINRTAGVLEQAPTFGTDIDVEYDAAVTTANELPSTFDELQIDAAVIIAEGVSITVNRLDLNATLSADGTADDNDQTVTVTDGGTVEVSTGAPVDAASDNGEIVYAGAFNIVYDATVTTENVIWAGTPASVTIDDGTTGTITVTLNANKATTDITVASSDALALGGNTLTVSGNVTGGAGISGGSVSLSGTAAQTLAGPLTLPTLIVNNSAGVTLTGGNLTLTTGLTLTEGTLNTGTFVVIIPHTSTSAQGFTRTNGYVQGTVRKTVPSGAGPANRVVFPVGINPYRPLAVTFNTPSQISGGITMDVSHVGSSPGGNNNMPLTTVDQAGNPLTIARYPDFYWTVTTSSTLSPSVSYDIELDAGGYAAFVGENIENTRTIRRQGGASTNFWTLAGGGVAGNNDNFAVSSTNPVTVVRNAVGALNASPGTIFTMGLESNLAAGTIAPVSVNAGSTADVDLSTVFTGGTSPFTYTVTSSDAAVATGAVAGGILTVTGVGAGSATLTITATDALNDTIVSTASVTVNAALTASPANTAVALNAGGTATFDLSTMFTGGAAPVTYAVTTSDAAVATGAEASGTLTITAVANGSATVTVTGTDATSATASATFTTTVNSAMAAAGTLSDISVDQGASSDVDVSGEFTGGDGTYTYTASAGTADATTSVAGSTVTVTGVNPYTGTGDDAVDTAPVTVTVTATDGLGSSVSSTFAADVQPVKGNVAGLGGPDPVSASLTLDAFLGLASLTTKQAAAADYNGDTSVTPFDAAQIFDKWLNPAAAAKSAMVTNPASDMSFGEIERLSTTVSIPVVVTGDMASAVAFSFETAIDPTVATVAGIVTAEGWTIRHTTDEDGTVRIAGFGLEALPAGGVVAMINLDLKDAGAAFTLKAQGAVNNNPATEIEGVEVVELPDNFSLLGNYPNPFNPSTNISFDLPASADVSIEVYDMLGRRVMVLPAQTIQAGSKRSVQLNASQLASGSYFYRVIAKMESKTQVDQGRMLLVK